MEIKKTSEQTGDILYDRGSIRKYKKAEKIGRDLVSQILQEAMTAPSSFNLQPWRFVVIDTDKGKDLIKPYMMFNQQQWETSAAIIAVYADLRVSETVDELLDANTEFGLMNEEYKEKMKEMITQYQDSYTPIRQTNALMLDCGFVTMQLMLSAKKHGYDTNPIGGFSREEMSVVLGIDTKRYLPVILVSIGKADEPMKDSVRYSADQITQWI